MDHMMCEWFIGGRGQPSSCIALQVNSANRARQSLSRTRRSGREPRGEQLGRESAISPACARALRAARWHCDHSGHSDTGARWVGVIDASITPMIAARTRSLQCTVSVTGFSTRLELNSACAPLAKHNLSLVTSSLCGIEDKLILWNSQ